MAWDKSDIGLRSEYTERCVKGITIDSEESLRMCNMILSWLKQCIYANYMYR